MGPELVGYFTKFTIELDDISQEIEAHIDDLKNEEFMSIFQEFYCTNTAAAASCNCLDFQIQNLRRTLGYNGKLDLLCSNEGYFSQVVNVFMRNVSTSTY